MSRAEQHSREVVEADRAELLRMIRSPIDRGHGEFGDEDYRPPMQAEACLGCGARLYGGSIPQCPVCRRLTPWRAEYEAYLSFERLGLTRQEDRSAAIRNLFDISPTAYAQRILRMLSDPRSLTVDAVTVRRLQRRNDLMSAARTSAAAPRSPRPDPRQRPLEFPSRPGNQSPASVQTSTPSGAEGTAESSAVEVAPDRATDDTAAAGDTFLPSARPRSAAPVAAGSDPHAAGETSEGVRARVENDRVWGRRDRLQRRPRPLGEHLRVLVHALRDLWRGIC